ncbi:hypothetical protein MKW98_028217, partial [Papaver atlanticum]
MGEHVAAGDLTAKTQGMWSNFFLSLHQCNMSVSLKVFWEWVLSAKPNLGWERPPFFVLSKLQQIEPVAGQLTALVYAIREIWLT